MNTVQEQSIETHQLFQALAGPSFKAYLEPPYTVKIERVDEPLQQPEIIKLRPGDIRCMNGRSNFEKLDYLLGRFGHLFKKR